MIFFTLLGKIIRINVDEKPYGIPKSNPFFGQKDKREEIWAWGLRNVWRFSFDKQTGDKYLADVGQNKWEEVNFEPASSKGGLNYGWRIMEANHCYDPKENCPTEGLIKPIIEKIIKFINKIGGRIKWIGKRTVKIFGVKNFKNGIEEGEQKAWDQNGNLMYKYIYHKGRKYGIQGSIVCNGMNELADTK